MSNNSLSPLGFSIRLIFALLLVFLTYNPTPYSFLAWVIKNGDSPIVYKVISGIVLLIGWAIYVRATRNSLGPIGSGLAAALLGCLVWLFVEWGFFDPNNLTAMTWVIEVIIAAILAIGMCWSHIRRKLTGQVDTDDVED